MHNGSDETDDTVCKGDSLCQWTTPIIIPPSKTSDSQVASALLQLNEVVLWDPWLCTTVIVGSFIFTNHIPQLILFGRTAPLCRFSTSTPDRGCVSVRAIFSSPEIVVAVVLAPLCSFRGLPEEVSQPQQAQHADL